MSFICTDKNSNLRNNFLGAVMNPIPTQDSLWFPDNLSPLDNMFFENIDKMNFVDMSCHILNKLFDNEIPSEDIKKIVNESFDFKIPLHSLDENTYILELFHGPTFTFKDIGARFMANILKYFTSQDSFKSKYGKIFDILVSTSGDTGSAVADAFQGINNVRVHILYPENMISEIQEKQMTSYGKNVFVYAVNGNFDDCQLLVKKSLKDMDLKDLCFFPANSINVARLIPQCLYYFWAYSSLKKKRNLQNIKLNICVPSGNLGNLSAGIIAWKLGLPINHFIGAVNENNTFQKYLLKGNDGILEKIKAKETYSSAMDISLPNNLKRLIYAFDYSNKKMSEHISSFSFDNQSTLNGINNCWEKYNYPIDPHTSVGYQAVIEHQKNKNSANQIYIILSTAHPGKFHQTMKMTNAVFKMPLEMQNILNNQINKTIISTDYLEWKKKLLKSTKNNITLIGMSGAGKSYLGEQLKEKNNFKFIDTDSIIEKEHGKKLENIIKDIGNKKFLEIEEEIILNLNGIQNIFSTGGSVVYSEKAMKYLKSISNVIFINTPLEILVNRVQNEAEMSKRGMVFKDGQSFKDVYNERLHLYKMYSDFTIESSDLNSLNSLNKII
ncbi:Shikimate kinase [seawater metagenome]|uniref:Shikimate kinase n=1 Tax=seawater metagenome TaxID=1561972 RepID=A0A5E8CJY2_9ZZZZ